jgi:hypothetical protein
LSRRGRSLPANASGVDPHRASITSRFDGTSAHISGAELSGTREVQQLGSHRPHAGNHRRVRLPQRRLSRRGCYACRDAQRAARSLAYSVAPSGFWRLFQAVQLLWARGGPREYARRFHPWRSTLTEIYLCHTCSCHEILRTETPGQVLSRAAMRDGAERALQCVVLRTATLLPLSVLVSARHHHPRLINQRLTPH